MVDLPQPVDPATSTMPRGDFGDLPDLSKQSQFFEARDRGFDKSHRKAPLTPLLEQIGAKPPDARYEIGEINFALLFEFLAKVGGDDLVTRLNSSTPRWDTGIQ